MSQAKATSPARKQPGRWRRRLLRLLGLLVVIALGCYWLLLPGLVRATIIRKLGDVGVTDASLDLRHVSWWRVNAANVKLGRPPWVRVGAVDIGYGLGGIVWGDPETVQITGGQWNVRVRDGAIDLGPIRLGRSDSRGPVALPFERLEIRSSALVIEDGAGAVRLPVEGSVVRGEGGRWRADLRVGDATAPFTVEAAVNGSLIAPPGASELSGELTLGIAGHGIDARGIRLKVEPEADGASGPQPLGARLTVDRLVVDGEHVGEVRAVVRRSGEGLTYEGAVEGPGWHLSLADGRLPAASTSADEAQRTSTARWELAGALPAAAARLLSERGIVVEDLGRLSVTGRAALHLPTSGAGQAAAAPWRAELPDVHARLEPGDLSFGRPGIALEGLSGDLLLGGTIDPGGLVVEIGPESSVEATRVEGAGFSSGPVRAVLGAAGDRPLATAAWDGRGVTADISVEMSAAEAVSLDAGGADATVGSLALDGRVQVAGGRVVPDLRVAFADAGVHHRRWNLEAEGISGSLRFTGLAPMSTRGGQQILIEQARCGKLNLTDGLLVFTIERPDSVLVERAEWRVAGGTRMRTIPFRFDPAAPVISTELYAEDAALSAWLPLLTDGRATGEGMLYGRLAVTVRPGAPAGLLTLGPGYLYAAPGHGWFAVRDATRLETWLDAPEVGLDQQQYGQQLKRRIVEALQDFEYVELRVDLIGEDDQLLCQLTTAGKGRQGKDPQEFEDLVIRIHDLNGVLNDLLSLKSAVNRAADQGVEP